MSIEHIMLEETRIMYSVWEGVVSFSMFLSIHELTFVDGPIFPFLVALTVGQVAEPLSVVCVVLGLIHDDTLALRDVMPDLAFVVAASGENESAVSLGKTISEGTSVIAAVFEEEFSLPVGLFILPLASVDDA